MSVTSLAHTISVMEYLVFLRCVFFSNSPNSIPDGNHGTEKYRISSGNLLLRLFTLVCLK